MDQADIIGAIREAGQTKRFTDNCELVIVIALFFYYLSFLINVLILVMLAVNFVLF